MQIAAYVCLGDPAWIEASVMSYYPYVTKIIATYDQDGLSWSGPEIDIEVCIRRLRAIDVDGKVLFVPGKFAIPSNFENPMLSDTNQRQVGLDVASEYGDWVLQLDTDEIIANWNVFLSHLEYAATNGYESLYYPSIYVYQLISKQVALESCQRWGRRQPGYPGPLCIRSGSTLYHSRRSKVSAVHVSCQNSYDTVIEASAHVVSVQIPANDCVVHITKGRSPDYMSKKFKTWSHASDRDYTMDLVYWNLVRNFRWICLPVSHLIRGGTLDKLRVFWIPASVNWLMHFNTIDGDLKDL